MLPKQLLKLVKLQEGSEIYVALAILRDQIAEKVIIVKVGISKVELKLLLNLSLCVIAEILVVGLE